MAKARPQPHNFTIRAHVRALSLEAHQLVLHTYKTEAGRDGLRRNLRTISKLIGNLLARLDDEPTAGR